MAADAVEELAEETMNADDLRAFLGVNELTHAEAAAKLDRSRRQIENYLSGSEAIPRIFVLACFGLLARSRVFSGPITRPHYTQATTESIAAVNDINSLRPHLRQPQIFTAPVFDTSSLS